VIGELDVEDTFVDPIRDPEAEGSVEYPIPVPGSQAEMWSSLGDSTHGFVEEYV
jgi:predicted transcriptional regulator